MTIAHSSPARSHVNQTRRAFEWKRSNPVFDAIVGVGAVNTKAACLIAARIEEDWIRGTAGGQIWGVLCCGSRGRSNSRKP